MERQTGYYWVRRPCNKDEDSDWEIALFENLPDRKIWTIMWFEGEFNDNAFIEINENRILNPEEK